MSKTSMVLYLTSASASAKSLSNGYARFDMYPPTTIPADRRYSVGLQSLSFTNYFINVSEALHNNTFCVTDDLTNITKYTVTISDGSYKVATLNSAINNALVNMGLPSNIVTITPDYSINKIIFGITTAGYMIYLPAGSCHDILGCPSIKRCHQLVR